MSERPVRMDLLRATPRKQGLIRLAGPVGDVDAHKQVLAALEVEATVYAKEAGLALARCTEAARSGVPLLLAKADKARARYARMQKEHMLLEAKIRDLTDRRSRLAANIELEVTEEAALRQKAANLTAGIYDAQARLGDAERAVGLTSGISTKAQVHIPDGSIGALRAMGVDTDSPIEISALLRSDTARDALSFIGAEFLRLKFRMRAVPLRLASGGVSTHVFPASDVELTFHMSRGVISSMTAVAEPLDRRAACVLGGSYTPFWHPHVASSGAVCLGAQAAPRGIEGLKNGNPLAAVEVAANVLSAYNHDSPYVTLSHWCANPDECPSLSDGMLVADVVNDKRRCPSCAQISTTANRCGYCGTCCKDMHKWDVALAAHSAGIGGGGCYLNLKN